MSALILQEKSPAGVAYDAENKKSYTGTFSTYWYGLTGAYGTT
jgi:hypothetical protein